MRVTQSAGFARILNGQHSSLRRNRIELGSTPWLLRTSVQWLLACSVHDSRRPERLLTQSPSPSLQAAGVRLHPSPNQELSLLASGAS